MPLMRWTTWKLHVAWDTAVPGPLSSAVLLVIKDITIARYRQRMSVTDAWLPLQTFITLQSFTVWWHSTTQSIRTLTSSGIRPPFVLSTLPVRTSGTFVTRLLCQAHFHEMAELKWKKLWMTEASLCFRWQTRAMQCLAPTVLYTDVDGQCDKLWPIMVTG